MKHLKLDLYISPPGVHAQHVMRVLGITYQHSTPQSMGDCWWFWNCENIPNPLPDYLSELTIDPIDAVGYGLTEEMAIEIKNYEP